MDIIEIDRRQVAFVPQVNGVTELSSRVVDRHPGLITRRPPERRHSVARSAPPFSNVAPGRTSATRCGPLTARQRHRIVAHLICDNPGPRWLRFVWPHIAISLVALHPSSLRGGPGRMAHLPRSVSHPSKPCRSESSSWPGRMRKDNGAVARVVHDRTPAVHGWARPSRWSRGACRNRPRRGRGRRAADRGSSVGAAHWSTCRAASW